MKKIALTLFSLLSLTLSMSAAEDGKFTYSYPPKDSIPYNLGFQDLNTPSDPIFGNVQYLYEPVKLTYNITSEKDKTVEVVFDPSYMELVDVVIPNKVIDSDTDTEYTVTAIGKMAFDDCPKIRSVIMGDSITRIEDYAFNMCENKTLHKIGYVKFSKNLTHIGDYAFKNCHNLTTGYYTEGNQESLVLSDPVKNIDYPFYGYGGRQSGLENYLLLPASVDSIGKHAFEGCYFEEIVDGTTKKSTRQYGLSKVKIPNPSCVIDDYAFAGCQFLELITIGEELTADGLTVPHPDINKGSIGDYAFANCNLMRLDIPSSIKSIGDNAFINCFHRSREHTPRKANEGRVYYDQLKWFYPRSLFNNYDSKWGNWENEALDYDASTKYNDIDSFLDGWHTNTVTIYSDKTKIGANAFANNPLLEKVIINGKAGEFEAGTFRNCPKLSDVKLPDDLTKLSNSMFMCDSTLNTITIPDNVREIGDSAFYMCEKLRTLELPSNLKNVNPYTFYGCKWLLLNTLPSEVSSIGNHAFFGCKEITSFTIPNEVTTIGDYAFADCYIHEFSRISDVPGWHYGLTNIKFGDGVQRIGAHAFDGCRHLGTIEMGKNITEIGDYAFQNCMSCPEDGCVVENNELTLPDCLTKMGTGAFQGCKYLPGITLGNEMTELPDFAFAHCSNLSYIENIANITSAKENTFLGCYNLEDFGNLYEDKGNLIDGIIYNDKYTEVISALPNITVADLSETNVVKIQDGAFANCGALNKVSFPETLKVIGSRAFSNCGELQKLEFPDSLEEIGSRAFENCISLQKADLIDVKMGEFVYAGCTGITTVFITQDFTQDIQDNWFAGCIYMDGICVAEENIRYSSFDDSLLLNKDEDTLLRAPSGLYDLYIPESVTKIGDYACSNCINLEFVEIPPTVKHIGAHAFDGCYYEELDNNGNVSNDWGLGIVYLTNPAVKIDEYAFNNCKLLNEIGWSGEAEPGDMGSIGAFAFNNCINLIFTTDNLISAAIDTIKPYAFANFPGIKDIELPETLENIGDHAFESCSNLSSVVFPESLKSIGNSAFKSTSLTSLDFTDNPNIVEIGDSAFMDCSQLMELKLPLNLKKINPYTFYKCFSGAQFDEKPEENFDLSIIIPDSVESIGDYAFYGCDTNFNKFYSNIPGNAYTHYHHYYIYGLRSLTINGKVKTIGAHAFDGCSHLLEVNLGDAVTSIGDYAFNDCFQQSLNGVREVEVELTGFYKSELDSYPVVWSLNSINPSPITLPESLKSLGEGAFNECIKLPSINFLGSLTEIPDQAFNGCGNLQEIKLPEGIHSIGDGAFGGCKGVKEISIPASFENGSRVFVDCNSAKNVKYLASKPKSFDEAFFSPKVYASHEAALYAPNALLEDLKGINPWALFYKIIAKDDTLLHLEKVLETKNNLRFRVLSNKPNPYCEVAGIVDTLNYYEVPEYVKNNDKTSPYYDKEYKVIRIGNDAFENNLTLDSIKIAETVFDIGQEAFNGCKNLKKITLPESITNMGERAFANCYGLTYFEVPPKVTRLNVGVLQDCRGLHSIRMHDDIEELCAKALMDCRHLRAFERSENWKLRLIDDYALKNCIELEHINIPEGVEKIGNEAMYYCQKLLNVSLPTTLREMGQNVFDDCERLTIIRVYTEKTPEIKGEANLTDQTCKIYVQAKTLDEYKEYWKEHAHRIEPGIQITEPLRTEILGYIPGKTHTINSVMPLEGQTMTWSTFNTVVATPDTILHDGTINIQAVGPTHIMVKTDQNFYHECDLDVYPQRADANWDGTIDISDAVNIANYVVDNKDQLINWWETGRTDFKKIDDWMRFYEVGAKVNNDDDISISDASAAMKKVLAQEPKQSPAAANRLRSISADDNRDALLLFAPEGNSVKVGLDNSKEYVALEAFVRVPEGMSLKNIIAGPRAAGHSLSTRRIDDRTMRVVLFDFNSSAFAESRESLIELTVEGEMSQADEIEIFEIIASDITSRSHDLTLRDGGIYTNVHSISDADKYIKTSKDGLIITGATGMHVAVYTLDGYTISSFDATSESEVISLPQGVYIVTVGDNSSKIAIK